MHEKFLDHVKVISKEGVVPNGRLGGTLNLDMSVKLVWQNVSLLSHVLLHFHDGWSFSDKVLSMDSFDGSNVYIQFDSETDMFLAKASMLRY